MSSVLVVAEQAGGVIRNGTWSALSAAREVARRTGGSLQAVLLGRGVRSLAEDLSTYGIAVHVADAPALEHYLAESWAPVVASVARAVDASHVCAGSSAFAKDLLPRLAARLGAAMANDVVGLAGEGADVTFRRYMWAGNVLAEVELATPIKVFTVQATEFPRAQKERGSSSVHSVDVDIDSSALRTRFVTFKEVRSERPELTDARIVIAGGRGTQGDFRDIEALADHLGAAVGASRAAVDAGWVPNGWQVGQTGKVVAPDLYIAAGIAGTIQHVAGMKGSKVIVAINKDADAPIFQIADYGLVADMFRALPELRAKLAAASADGRWADPRPA